jgi:hypothetical protein
MREPKRWTEAEDYLLRSGVAAHCMPPSLSIKKTGDSLTSTAAESQTIDWKQVASLIEGRTNKDCRKRWVYSLSPNINNGPWLKSESALLVEGVKLHGTK